jgi:mannitol/fructose-specific phosphotransferase system IIA component (Ntr-type)
VGLAEIFRPEAIIVGLTNRTKPGAIAELVHSLVALGRLGQDAEQTVAASVLTREKLGTTALGNGIAFPHCRTSCTEKFVGALGLEPRGIPFDAVDGEPVFSIFLLLAPLEGREQYFDVLGRIAAVGRDKSQRFQLRGLRTAEQAHHFLQEMDRR